MLYSIPSILVVEPHHDTCHLLRTILSHAGYRVATAATHADGLATVQRVRPDLVVTGARLPGVPLFSLVDQLRAAPDTRDLPVLICTTAVTETRARYDDTYDPHTAVVFKPFDIDDLIAAAGVLLQGAAKPLRPDATPVLV